MLGSIALLQTAQIAGRVLFFVFSFWYINRFLGLQAKGLWTGVFSLYGILAVFSNMGFEVWLSRAAARGDLCRASAIRLLFRAKTGLWALALIAGGFHAIGQGVPWDLALAFAVALVCDGIGVAQQAVFEGKRRTASMALMTFLKSGGFALLALAWAALEPNPSLAVFGWLFAAVLALRALWGRRAFGLLPVTRIDPPEGVWRQVLLLGAYTFVTVLYFQIDAVMLFSLTDRATTGDYGNAYNLVEGALFLSASVSAVLYPRLVTANAATRALLLDRGLHFVIALAAAAVLGFWFVGEPVGHWLLGRDFDGGAELLRILGAGLPFMFANGLLSRFLFAQGRERYALFTAAGMALFNIAGNAWAIPHMGALGAAWMTVATEGLLFLIWVLSGRGAPRMLLSWLGMALCTAPAALLLFVLDRPLWAVVAGLALVGPLLLTHTRRLGDLPPPE